MHHKRRSKKIISIITLLIGLFTLSNTGYAETAFPVTKTAKEASDILKVYQPYLDFIVQVGRETDASSTQKLLKIFDELKRRNPEAAARFLKGLRFEMMDKAERMARREVSLSSRNPEMQKWVARFIKDWTREADEHLYRVYSSQLAKK